MQSENLTCVWNDVALLTDQRACTFLCKTMLRFPDEEAAELDTVELKGWNRIDIPDAEKELTGNAVLCLGYRNQQGEQKQVCCEIRMRGKLREAVNISDDVRLLYSRGKFAQNCLLLEVVVQIRQELKLQRSQVIAGQFEMNEQIELPQAWPDCLDVLMTTVEADVQSFTIENRLLQVEGMYHLTLVYVDETQPGECLFACQQHRPMKWSAEIPAGLQELTGVQFYYQSLAVKQLSTRLVQISGNGVVCTLPEENQEPELIVEPEAAGMNENHTSFIRRRVPCGPSVINSRGSRRENLSRYMRDLNGMGQSPTTVRNFEIARNPGDEDTEDE